MTEQLPGYRTSSARRRGHGPTLLTAAIVILVALTSVLTILRRDQSEPPKQSPSPTSTKPRDFVSTATATATETTTRLTEYSTEWVVAQVPTVTPSPWPTFPPPATATARPEPSPTPLTSECVDFRWGARQVFAPSAQVMVEIEAVNRCKGDLGPLELWFEVTGWRQGGRVQSVRGHPFDRIRPGASGIVAIGLPGSIDWYDEITVEIVD